MGLSGSKYCLFTIDTSDLQEFPKLSPPISSASSNFQESSDWDEAAQPCLVSKDLDAPPIGLDITDDSSCLWTDCWTEGAIPEIFASREVAVAAARNFAEQQNFPRAFNAYRAALTVKANSPTACHTADDFDAPIYDGLGELCLNANRFEDAARFYETATWLDNLNIEYWYKRGIVYQSLSQLDDAKGCFVRSLQLAPDYIPAMFSLGVVQQRLGNYDDALNQYQGLLALEPGNTEVLVLAAECFEVKQNLSDAIYCIDRVLEEDPSYTAARHMGSRLRTKLVTESGRTPPTFGRSIPRRVGIEMVASSSQLP